MKKIQITILSKLMNSLLEGEIHDEDVLFILNNAVNIPSTDEYQIIRYIFTCTASMAYMVQKNHSKDVCRQFFDELAKVVSSIDEYMGITDSATDTDKVRLLESFRNLHIVYGKVIASDAGDSTLGSACEDLVIQSAINGMLLSMMEKIDQTDIGD